jgi:hypothetical protein
MPLISFYLGGRCGSDSVVVAWDSLVLVVGPYNESISYTYESSVFMVTEVDGVRIYSDKLHEFLQKVPGALFYQLLAPVG